MNEDRLFDLFELEQGGLARSLAGTCRTLEEPIDDTGDVTL